MFIDFSQCTKYNIEQFALIITLDFKPPMKWMFFYRRGLFSVRKVSTLRKLDPNLGSLSLKPCMPVPHLPAPHFGSTPHFFISLLLNPRENSIKFLLCLKFKINHLQSNYQYNSRCSLLPEL